MAMGVQFRAVACVEEGKRGKVFLDATIAPEMRPDELASRARLRRLDSECGLSVPDEPVQRGSALLTVQLRPQPQQ